MGLDKLGINTTEVNNKDSKWERHKWIVLDYLQLSEVDRDDLVDLLLKNE